MNSVGLCKSWLDFFRWQRQKFFVLKFYINWVHFFFLRKKATPQPILSSQVLLQVTSLDWGTNDIIHRNDLAAMK